MNWLTRLLPGDHPAANLDPALLEKLEQWRTVPGADLGISHNEKRYVVVNTEATGLDLNRDTLVSVAAISVDRCLVNARNCVQLTLDPDPAAALVALLEFIGKAPVVVFNASVNKQALLNAFDKHLGFEPELEWLDLYWILPSLFNDRHASPARLVEWVESMEIDTFKRQDSLGDAYAVAQLLLAALARATLRGHRTVASLIEMELTRKRLQR
ncbi:MAG: 3'-5' exonuclease [Rhodocyclaceae bacterium]|nr:3'-5' exonuclease [Rhodocyclaceae bacterium]MCB1963051.1 3'-5' exonuclease [Rhodocyclaceae bacterium]